MVPDLAIAALKLGAAKAIGIDIDPQAIQASRDNAERNGVSDRLELYLPKDQPEEMEANAVVANILAGPLRELAPLISVLPVSGGLLGLSRYSGKPGRERLRSLCRQLRTGTWSLKERVVPHYRS
ncbi:50S ribosomal protein L11 methyltransferase [Escherichia coli]